MEKERLKYLEGTTTVGLACKDGVILASDSRATAGYLIASKEARKVFKVSENIGMTIAGGVGDAQSLVDILKVEMGYYSMREGEPMPVNAAARLIANVLNYYRMFPFIANLIVGGVDGDGARVYFIDLDGSLVEDKMVSTGSGSPVAYGVLEGEFSENMTVKQALPIAIRAVKTAMKRDIATGNEIKVATITRDGYRELPPEEIRKLA